MMLCQPTGGLARLTEGCSFRRKVRGDNHVGRDNHGGVAGEQPNGFNNQMGGMETRLG